MASLLRRVATTFRVPHHARTSIGGIRTNMMDTANFTDEQIAVSRLYAVFNTKSILFAAPPARNTILAS